MSPFPLIHHPLVFIKLEQTHEPHPRALSGGSTMRSKQSNGGGRVSVRVAKDLARFLGPTSQRSARGVACAASQIDLQLLELGDVLIDAPLP